MRVITVVTAQNGESSKKFIHRHAQRNHIAVPETKKQEQSYYYTEPAIAALMCKHVRPPGC
eukprot:m.1289161 g.1289161  ORF g.1289161 m.1289161 type:complete len:61 (+) comp24782_c0_seq28:68-250(+)